MKFIPKWSVENPVMVGVLMMAIIIGGVYSAATLVREMFPEAQPTTVLILTLYPGASPVEVEKGIAIPIEEAIENVDGIDKIVTQISEGINGITVTLKSDVEDVDQVVNDLKAAIDAIPPSELPADAEKTQVAKFEARLPVISVAIYGETDEAVLKETGQRLRDDLATLLPGTRVELSGTRKAELTVELDPEKLVEYHISLTEVAQHINSANLDLPGGQIKTSGQNVSIRTLGETDDASRIAETILRSEGGKIVRIKDLGRVLDGFEDTDVDARFNGHPAVDVTVFKTASQDAVEIASRVKAFVAGKNGTPIHRGWLESLKSLLRQDDELTRIYEDSAARPVPSTLSVAAHSDLSRFIESRLDLLKRNGFWGLVLVFLSLMLFLNWRVSFWVMMGLLLSISGALAMMSFLGETLNLISMFGLIVVLGLVVDDAIVVGENVYAHVERGSDPRRAAIEGTHEVSWPVIIAVLTTVGAFLPLMFIEGTMGDFMGVLPVVVMCALAISLIESLSILPCHLADWLKPVKKDMNGVGRPRHWLAARLAPIRQAQQDFFHNTMGGQYEKLLRAAVRYRYVTFAFMIGCSTVSLAMYLSGRTPFVYMQKMDSEMLTVDIEMPIGTPIAQTEAAMRMVEEAVAQVDAKADEIDSMYTMIGLQMDLRNESEISNRLRSHLAQGIIELKTVEARERTSEEIIADFRALTAELPGINSIKFVPLQGGPGGKEIEIEVTGENMEQLVAASARLKEELARYAGVLDIADDFEEGQRELKIEMLDAAHPLGLTTRMLATELRGAFYGLEAKTLQRKYEDVNIRVRFPEERRREIHELESMRIATPSGAMVPLSEVARVSEGRGYAALRRVDGKRAVIVSADVDQSVTTSEKVIKAINPELRKLTRDLPGVGFEFAGTKQETNKSLRSLQRDFCFAVLAIYVMLAGMFRSYIQPLIVLVAIPLGLNGVVAGHWLMGYPLTLLSLIGIVALTGIVVNDSLILVDFVNKERRSGTPLFDAVIAGSRKRFRAIILTSLTTILGLAPLMTETSFQARFLIPMAISISFGVAVATVLTLLVVPSFYMIVEDIREMLVWIWYGRRRERPVPGEAA